MLPLMNINEPLLSQMEFSESYLIHPRVIFFIGAPAFV